MLAEKLKHLNGKELLIYGAGSFGKEMAEYLEKQGMKIEAFLDENAGKSETVNGKKIYTLESYSEKKENKTVIMAAVCDKELRKKIYDDIKNSGFNDVISAQSIRCLYIDFENGYNKKHAFKRIEKVYNMLADEMSRNIFTENIYANLTRDYSEANKFEKTINERYFPNDIKADYSAFIDCGGFTGDTVKTVFEKYKPKRIVSFEPSAENYKKLAELVSKLNCDETEFILFNNAVSDKISQHFFETETDYESFSQNKTKSVLTVSLDEILRGFNASFLKMDIAGEELRALSGAKGMIEKNHPDMAVCVYHNIEHIWEIPLYIHSLYDGYEFYLRSYNEYTMKTVLYAVKNLK